MSCRSCFLLLVATSRSQSSTLYERVPVDMIYFDNDSVHFSTNPSILGEIEFLRPCRSQLHELMSVRPLDQLAGIGRQQIPEVLGRCQGRPRKDVQKTLGKQTPCYFKIEEYFGRRLFSISPLAPSFPSAG